MLYSTSFLLYHRENAKAILYLSALNLDLQNLLSFFRMANARAKAEQADLASEQAHKDSDIARLKAKEYAPEFHQPGNHIFSNLCDYEFIEKYI